jgi:ADP-heptose:LPS heptosyltransferase
VLHVAPDTGTLHIAAALGTTVVAVYGPTSPERVGPWGQPEAVVHRRDLCGRGCPAYCRFRRRCLDAIPVEAVVDRARAAVRTSIPS